MPDTGLTPEHPLRPSSRRPPLLLGRHFFLEVGSVIRVFSEAQQRDIIASDLQPDPGAPPLDLGALDLERFTGDYYSYLVARLDGLSPTEALRYVSPLGRTRLNNGHGASIEFHGRNDTDLANGRRFAVQHRDRARYVPAWGWVVWDGHRWARDTGCKVMALATETVKGIYAEASKASGEAERKALGDHAKRSESLRARKAMLESAQAEPEMAAQPDDFDADPWLFTCANGTLDLRTGKLRPHDPRDLITKASPVAFDPQAAHPLWTRYLDYATNGDAELEAYLRRACGYCLTGCTGEQVFFLLLGPEATGKSTLVEAMLAVMGDYAVKASFDTFLERRDVGGPRPDIASMAGARLVAACETSADKRLAEAMLKELVGGDSLTARHLYHESFTFVPQAKLVLAANESPKIRDRDSALWRRLRRLPFEHIVPEGKRDPAIKAALTNPKDAGPAILAWAVRGCLEWRQQGLGYPDTIRDKTAALRQSMDPLGEFFSECCVLGDAFQTPAAELRQAYEAWAKENGSRATVGGKEWGERLREVGAERAVMRRGDQTLRVWRGIGLTTEMQPSAPAGLSDHE